MRPREDQVGSMRGALSGVSAVICRNPLPSAFAAHIPNCPPNPPVCRETAISIPSGDQHRFFFRLKVLSEVILLMDLTVIENARRHLGRLQTDPGPACLRAIPGTRPPAVTAGRSLTPEFV